MVPNMGPSHKYCGLNSVTMPQVHQSFGRKLKEKTLLISKKDKNGLLNDNNYNNFVSFHYRAITKKSA